jgi:hypothetical protein
MNRLRSPWGAIVGIWLTSAVVGVDAQVSTEESASIIVFPKVITDGSWDTTIQIANGANRPTYATCHYVNGQLTFPDQPPGPLNEPLWAGIDFTIALGRQQPTHWVASRGRTPQPTSGVCDAMSADCDAAGLVPGRIPPVPEGFTGELVCIEVDASGAPWTGNGLSGVATLTHLATGEVVKYPAVGLAGFPANDADGRLCLGGEPSTDCPLGAEYAACPSTWIVSHPSDYDDRTVDGSASRTRLTVVPCTQSLDDQIPGQITLQFQAVNELEMTFSATTTVQCWGDFDLADVSAIFDRDVAGGDWLQTRIRATSSSTGGFMVVQQTVRESARPPGLRAVATTPHQDGNGSEVDVLVLPGEGGQ